MFESRGELKLLQRSSLIKLARENSIEIKGLDQVFEDVSLDEEEGPKQSKDSTEQVKLDLKHPKLLQAIQSKDSFVDEFTKLTEGILEDFMGCDRSKTIDVLSIDLAILNYEKGDYSECLQILRLIRFLYSEWMELFRWHIIRNLLWMYGENSIYQF